MTTSATDLEALATRAGTELDGADAVEILRWADETFGAGLVVTTSLQDAVLLDLADQIRPGIDAVFLDTGYHFAETVGMRAAVQSAHTTRLLSIEPLRTVAEQDAEHGARLYERDPNLCCALRKVEPLERSLAPYTAWVTGIRRVDAPTRRDVRVIEWDAKRSKVKVNPLAAWSDDDLLAYVERRGVLVNPLQYDGYPSIGCAPCTRRVSPGDDPRSGRWAGTGKVECGLHS